MIDLEQTQKLEQDEKLEYAQIVLDIISADEKFDAEEIQKIYMIFSIFKISKITRQKLLNDYIERGRKHATNNIPQSLQANETVKFLLAKDIMTLEGKATKNQQLLQPGNTYLKSS